MNIIYFTQKEVIKKKTGNLELQSTAHIYYWGREAKHKTRTQARSSSSGRGACSHSKPGPASLGGKLPENSPFSLGFH